MNLDQPYTNTDLPELTLVKSDSLDDWYTIERKDHENRIDFIPTEYGASLWFSGRISDADVEGTSQEMLDIADAILSKSRVSHHRCAVIHEGNRVLFNSPRNSLQMGVTSPEHAVSLAMEIKGKFKSLSNSTKELS